MKTHFPQKLPKLVNRALLAAGAMAWLVSQPAQAATEYLVTDASGLSGPPYAGTVNDNVCWNTTSETGAGSTFANGATLSIGNSATDATWENCNVNINLNTAEIEPGGIVIYSPNGSANISVTLSGSSDNSHSDHNPFPCTVDAGATLILTTTVNNNGFNWNKEATTFSGGGTISFQDAFMANDSGAVTNNGCVLQLSQALTSNFGEASGASFTLTAGTLEFMNATALADAFVNFTTAGTINLDGGTIDNLSGSAGTLTFGPAGTYTIGGSFTFIGSSSLSLGTNAVTLTATPTITINSGVLTIGGPIGGAGNGLTVAGDGTLDLAAANTYSGNTTIDGGSLVLSGSGSVAGPITVAAGALFDVSQLPSYSLASGQALGNSTSTATIAGNLDVALGALSLTYAAGTPSLISTNGTLTISSASAVTINNTGAALAPGTYTIIAPATSGNAGSVAGIAPSSVTVTGGGIAAGDFASLDVNGGELDLIISTTPPLQIVASSATPSSITRFQSTLLSVTVTNGTAPYTVTVDASSLGGSGSLNLVQDGAEPAGVYVYTNGFMPPNTTAAGNYTLPVTVAGSAGGHAYGEVFLTITGSSLVWNGDASGNSDWANGVVEWQGGLPYADGDFVRFDDTATGLNAANVNVSSVSPGGITVSNTTGLPTAEYSFSGGQIGGSGGLLKQGSGTLLVDDNNIYTGGTTITGGTVQLGNGDGNGTLGSGPVANNGSLTFDKPGNSQVVNNNISGTGSVTEEGADTLTLAGFDTFTGNVLVNNNSTLAQGSSNALGFNNTVTIASGSSLDLHGHAALNGNAIVVGGNGDAATGLGAIDNNATNAVYPALSNVTLTASTTFGATSGRWDLRSPGGDGADPGTSILSTEGNPYDLIKTGPQFIGIVSTTVDPMLADIDLQNGTLDFEGDTTGLGNPANTLTIEGYLFNTQGTFEMWNATNQLNKMIVLNDGGTILNGSGANTIVGPMNITNSAGAEYCIFSIGGTSLTLSNTLTGNGLIYTPSTGGAGTLYINGNSPDFAGGISMNAAGPIVVDGVLSNALGVTVGSGKFTVNGQLLGAGVSGGGTLAGSGDMDVPVDASGPVFPGDSGVVGTLTTSNLTLESSATVTFDLGSSTTVGGGVNDLIAVNGNLTANGATISVNASGLLQKGVPYTIFTYSGSFSGSFSVAGSDAYTYTIDTSTQGVVNLIASGGPPIWNGGSTTNSDWSDSNNWAGVALQPGDILYFDGNNRLNNTNDTAAGTSYNNIVFLPTAAGTFTLNGTNDIQMAGEIENNSSYPQVVDIPLAFGQRTTLAGGASPAAPLIIGAGITNTLSGFNGLTLTGNGILTNLMASAAATDTNELFVTGASTLWDIVDNPSSMPITVPWELEVTNGTLVFGNAGSAPNFTSTTAQGGPEDNQIGYLANGTGTLIISNGTFTTSARMNTGPVGGATGVVDVVSGTLSVASEFQGANGANTSGSAVNVSGGTMTTPGTFFVASRGVGSLTISGTGAVSCGALDISRDASGTTGGSIGTVNLDGGTLSCTEVSTATANAQATPGGNAPSATVNFNGGTLLAKANSATFYQGSLVAPIIPVTTFIQAGGATINDGGFSIGINEALQTGAAPDGGLTKLGAGTVTLNKTNTYNGPTTILAGTLALGATGNISIDNTAPIIIAGGATFNVSALTSPFQLAAGQVLTNSSSTAAIVGSFEAGSGVLSLTYAAGTPALSVGGGTFTLSATSGLVINNTSVTPLPVGVYTIISDATGGTVSGTLPTSFTVTGGGTQGGQPLALKVAGGALELIVGHPALPADITSVSINGTTLTMTATGGADNGQFTLLESTNLLLPISQWTPVFTNNFDANGNLNISTNVATPNTPQEFYLLQMP